MEFSRPDYRSGQLIPSSVGLPDSGIELGFPEFQVDSLPTELPGNPTEEGKKLYILVFERIILFIYFWLCWVFIATVAFIYLR